MSDMRMPGSKIALIAGSTGLIGGHCLRLLLDHPAYAQVIALVRKPQPIQHPRYREIVTSFADLGSIPPVAADDAFCAVGTTIKKAGSKEAFRHVDHDAVANFAYWARAGETQCFCVVSSVGADSNSGTFYLAVKGEMEEGIAEQRFPRAHIFRPSVLLGDRQESRPGESLMAGILRLTAPLLIGPLREYRAIEAATVAQAMVNAAQQNHAGRFVHTYQGIRQLAGSSAA